MARFDVYHADADRLTDATFRPPTAAPVRVGDTAKVGDTALRCHLAAFVLFKALLNRDFNREALLR